jgi:hypothetical protein
LERNIFKVKENDGKKIKIRKTFIKIGNYFPRPIGNFHR